MKTFFFFVSLHLSFSGFVYAQQHTKQINDTNMNFYETQSNFNDYWKNKPIEKGKGWKPFKRWEWFMEQRLYPSGNTSVSTKAINEFYQKNLFQKVAYKTTSVGNWQAIGPSVVPKWGGAGRINCIKIDPTNSKIIYAGSPSGGLWKSVDGGAKWTTNTDNLAVLGISDIAIDPSNTQIMYVATGDADSYFFDTQSIGVLKSINGGQTWDTTGLTWNVSHLQKISKIIIHPNNTSILLAATSNGVYRSINGGTTWTIVQQGNFRDIKFKPGNPSVVYATSTSQFFKSTDAGISFTNINTGLPSPSAVSRLAIGVSSADSNYVYVLAVKEYYENFYGLYLSTDGGNTFSLRSNYPDILRGQGNYDLAIAVSPTNKNEIIAGGVDLSKSLDAGKTWKFSGNSVHADHHTLETLPDSNFTCFLGNDGGIYKTADGGTSWSDLSNGLQIAQMYRLGTSALDSNQIVTGLQDNDCILFNNPDWEVVLVGDGMECIVDYSNSNIIYAGTQLGEISWSVNKGKKFKVIVSSYVTGIDEPGDWITPFIINPKKSSTLLVGKSQVYKITNIVVDTSSVWQDTPVWTQIDTITGGTGKITALAYAPSDTNYIYAAKKNKFYVCTDGKSFTDLTLGLPVDSAAITYIAVSHINPKKVWVTFSGYSDGNKVYFSSDAGATWKNVSAGLPNLPVNCIVYQNNSNDILYVGTDVGVYYIDSSMSAWLPYNNGLPNVIVMELEIHYGSKKLLAATYGRGLWKSDLYIPATVAPVADFKANTIKSCSGIPIQFTDLSTFYPASWKWVFTGGTPSVSTSQNPSVIYSAAGTYPVSLTVTNAKGTNSKLINGYITVSSVPTVFITASGATNLCQGDSVKLTASTAASYLWNTGATTASVFVKSSGNYSVKITDVNGCNVVSSIMAVTVNSLPQKPKITQNKDSLSTVSAIKYQWNLNNKQISGSTSQTHIVKTNGSYSVTVTDSNGCTATSDSVNVLTTGNFQYEISGIQLIIYPNPANNTINYEVGTSEGGGVTVKVFDVTGRAILTQSEVLEKGLTIKKLSTSTLSSGVYLLQITTTNKERTQKQFVVK